MISKDLVNILNSGDAVTIVGSGISANAGLPTWSELFTNVADLLGPDKDTSYARQQAKKYKLPQAFETLSKLSSREYIHGQVSNIINKSQTPCDYHNQLADWPCKMYVTTNYDSLLESASKLPLTKVGNRGNELRKISGGTRDIVWHIHGCSSLHTDYSQLVVTQSDYDDYYPYSNAIEKLKAITSMHRCIYVGFGFNDADLIHVLQAVGRHSNSGVPSYAFLGYEKPFSAEAYDHQNDLKARYNVEVLPYAKNGSDHSKLQDILNAYKPFVVRRSISLGKMTRATPTYDPTVSSLKIHNCLDIGELTKNNHDLRTILIGAKILSFVREHPGCTAEDVCKSFDPKQDEDAIISACIEMLQTKGDICEGKNLNITPAYEEKTTDINAFIELERDKFKTSLSSRLMGSGLNAETELAVVNSVASFFDALCRERGLGVAQNLATTIEDQAAYRCVALMQELPEYLAKSLDHDGIIKAISISSEILTNPHESESIYLGLLCQAYFGQHLVGSSSTINKVDIGLLSSSCFILDASVIINLLAEGCKEHKFTKALVNDLIGHESVIATMDLFINEIVEHVEWAYNLVDRHGENSPTVIDACRCKGSFRPNEFLIGYYNCQHSYSSFKSYLEKNIGAVQNSYGNHEIVINRLKDFNISSPRFDGWLGFTDDLFADRVEIQKEIGFRRENQATFKHDRQTKAEAEVSIIVDKIRRGDLKPTSGKATDAFFVSGTRIVNNLPGLTRKICLLPEGLSQWLWSTKAHSREHAAYVFDQLVYELAISGIKFVNEELLNRRFSGVIEAAEVDLKIVLDERREYLVEKYGPNPNSAFLQANRLDLPRFAEEVKREVLNKMEIEVKKSRERELEARTAARISEKDRRDHERLKRTEKKRKEKKLKKSRALQSAKKKRKRNR